MSSCLKVNSSALSTEAGKPSSTATGTGLIMRRVGDPTVCKEQEIATGPMLISIPSHGILNQCFPTNDLTLGQTRLQHSFSERNLRQQYKAAYPTVN